jgi:hypothetical protein
VVARERGEAGWKQSFMAPKEGDAAGIINLNNITFSSLS